MKRVKFIYNPSSGESAVPDLLDEIITLYQKNGYSLIPYRLTFDGNPFDIIYDLDDTYHHLVVAGGDGTVNYIVNLLKRNNIDIPVAVLPTGTANDFASLLRIPTNILKACKTIIEGRIESVDLGRVNGEYFVNVFSCGLLTDVSQKTPTILKNTFGKLAYYVGGIGELSRFRKMQVDIRTDDGDYEGSCVIFFVFNGRTAGNFKIAHLSEINDGLLDVVILKGDNPLKTINTAMRFLTALGKKKKYPAGVIHMQCKSIKATCETNESTDIDGQSGPDFPLEITCEADALRIIVPKSKPKRRRKAPLDTQN